MVGARGGGGGWKVWYGGGVQREEYSIIRAREEGGLEKGNLQAKANQSNPTLRRVWKSPRNDAIEESPGRCPGVAALRSLVALPTRRADAPVDEHFVNGSCQSAYTRAHHHCYLFSPFADPYPSYIYSPTFLPSFLPPNPPTFYP